MRIESTRLYYGPLTSSSHMLSVGAFLGLLLLAISLIIGGVVLIVGYEHIRSRFFDSNSKGDETVSASGDATDAKATRRSMRPYRKAKETGVARDDRLYGLIFVFAGLALLYVIPAYIFGDKTHLERQYGTPSAGYTGGNASPHSRKLSLSDSKPGQAVLGGLTLVILIVSFSMIGGNSNKPSGKEPLNVKLKGSSDSIRK